MRNNNKKDKIVNYLKERGGEPTTIKNIMSGVNISYPTADKWVAVLIAEGKILMNDYGNIKFYYAEGVKSGRQRI